MKNWSDAYLLALFFVSVVAMGDWKFSRWLAGLAVAMWIGFALLHWKANICRYNSRHL